MKLGLEAGKDEETIERETGVSDRTIRRWKMELERTGRIGKPPEARTGRHRVLSAEIEAVCWCRRAHVIALLTRGRRCSSIPRTNRSLQ